jgi:hypothetical protein
MDRELRVKALWEEASVGKVEAPKAWSPEVDLDRRSENEKSTVRNHCGEWRKI